jgi:SAM-dependent methyltransferase
VDGLDVIRRLLNAFKGPSDDLTYANRLLDEFHRFVVSEYGSAALPREQFLELFWRHQRSGISRPANRYVGDLWYLFRPDFLQRLPEYYKTQELLLTMRFLGYAASTQFLQENYVEPYRLLLQRRSRSSVLEIGAGVPHGFVYHILTEGASWCRELVVVDVDAIYTSFVKWFCVEHQVPHRVVNVEAGRAPVLPESGAFDFVYAKDVFEHLDDPAAVVDAIVRVAAPGALLALDLEDKGDVIYQHISPSLTHLKPVVTQSGFTAIGQSGTMTMFERGIPAVDQRSRDIAHAGA